MIDLARVARIINIRFDVPDPNYWSKRGISRIYYNHPKKRDDPTYIELKGEDIFVSDYSNYWKDIFHMEPIELKILILQRLQSLENTKSKNNILSNFFLVRKKPPQLFAHRIHTSESNMNEIGPNIAKRLQRVTPGNWIYTNFRLLSDRRLNPSKLEMIIEHSFQDFSSLSKIEHLDLKYKLNSKEVAQWYANILNAETGSDVFIHTSPHEILDNAVLAIDVNKGNTVNEYKIGTKVGDISSSLQGTIQSIIGILGDHRERLLDLTSRDQMLEILRSAPDAELIYGVLVHGKVYDYTASALYSVSDDIDPIIETNQIQEKYDFIGERFTSENYPDLFQIEEEKIDNFKIIFLEEISEDVIFDQLKKFENSSDTIIYVSHLYLGKYKYYITSPYSNSCFIELKEHPALLRGDGSIVKGDTFAINKDKCIINLEKTYKVHFQGLTINQTKYILESQAIKL